jgi:hypothetical protein
MKANPVEPEDLRVKLAAHDVSEAARALIVAEKPGDPNDPATVAAGEALAQAVSKLNVVRGRNL